MNGPFYVARDRARRIAHLLGQAAQERRLAYRGDEIGMASLRNEALSLLATADQELTASVEDVLAARLRDRERAYMDIPFTVMAEAVRDRVRLALRLERARAARGVPETAAQEQVLALLASADRRLTAFCAAYDEKRPLALPRATDVARLLHLVEADASWERHLRPPGSGAPFDAPPPELLSQADGLDDLLRAARAVVPGAAGPWRLERGQAGGPLALSLGEPDTPDLVDLPVPPRLERAARVLSFVTPAGASCRGRAPARPVRQDWGADPAASAPPLEPQPVLVTLRLPDPASGSTTLAAGAGAGADARLSPEAEKAVRALLAAPPLPEAGTAPPSRTIALLGVLRAFDAELLRVLLPRLSSGPLREAAQALPREDTRKAPVRRDLLAALEAALPGFPAGRLEEVVDDVAHGKAGRKRCVPLDAAVLLAVFGRSLLVGGFKGVRALRLDPWTDDDVLATCRDLLDLSQVRRDLDAGKGVEAPALTRLERAAVALLGRLGRLG